MEKSLDWQFDSYMQEIFQMKEVDIREYSPLALAYIGDCIFDLVIKSLVMNEGNKQVQKMHKETSSYVQASAQSKMMRTIQEHLTEEEHGIYKRGRNAKSVSPAKNQSITDYKMCIRDRCRSSGKYIYEVKPDSTHRLAFSFGYLLEHRFLLMRGTK